MVRDTPSEEIFVISATFLCLYNHSKIVCLKINNYTKFVSEVYVFLSALFSEHVKNFFKYYRSEV